MIKKRNLLCAMIGCLGFVSNAKSLGEATIVTFDDRILKVYNLDSTEKYVYFSYEASDTVPFYRLPISEILAVKDVNGKKVELVSEVAEANAKTMLPQIKTYAPRPAVTWIATGNTFINKDNSVLYEVFAENDSENRLWVTILSDNEKTAGVTRAPKKQGMHPSETLIIPDTVVIDEKKYTITSIEKEAFFSMRWGNPYETSFKEISFPETLEIIGENAFSYSFIGEYLIFPQNLKSIGKHAFRYSGASGFKELYLPKSVSTIGSNAFQFLGGRRGGLCSYNGYFQGNVTCMPDYITTGNCTNYGIDEEAVENYELRIGIRKEN